MSLDLTELGGFGNADYDMEYEYGLRDCDTAFNVAFGYYNGNYITDSANAVRVFPNYDWDNPQVARRTDTILTTNILYYTKYNHNENWSDFTSPFFDEGYEFMIHYVALRDTSITDPAILAKLGTYQFVKTTNYFDESNGYLCLDRAIEIDLQNFFVQAVFVHICKNFTLPADNTYAILPFDSSKMCGGVCVIKCNGTFTMEAGAKIDLTDCGLPASLAANRPLLPHERSGTGAADVDPCAGSENSITHNRLLLNVGDGAIMIIARNIEFTDNTTRIGCSGGDTRGVHYCRGADDSVNKPEGYTIVGGSTIFIATENLSHFTDCVISKYRYGSSDDGEGKGLARCYIATADKRHENSNYYYLPTDEGLYAHDVIHRADSLPFFNGVYNYGGGTAGTHTISGTETFNNYAHVTAFGSGYVDIDAFPSTADYFKPLFSVGALVMTHVTKTNIDEQTGKVYNGIFVLGRITRVDGNRLYLDRSQIPNGAVNSHAIGQIIAIPEFNNLTVTGTIKPSKVFDTADGCGGIIALAVNGTLDLRGGKINVEGYGAERSWQNRFEGNRYMVTNLPIGAGHGSAFILARNVIMDANTRIGATYTGKAYGGKDISYSFAGGGYHGKGDTRGGHGGAGGVNGDYRGGWHDNGTGADTKGGGRQGAHLFIVANKITGFNIAAISTGGENGYGNVTDGIIKGGGAGYGGGGGNGANESNGGGGGGFQGGGAGAIVSIGSNVNRYYGGGGAGACVIYCNQYENADFDAIVLS